MNKFEIEPEICDECKNEFEKKELTTCSTCKKQLCKLCLDFHSEEHYLNKKALEDYNKINKE